MERWTVKAGPLVVYLLALAPASSFESEKITVTEKSGTDYKRNQERARPNLKYLCYGPKYKYF